MGEIKVTRTCREFMMTQAYIDTKSRANCATCVKWDKYNEKCADEVGVVKRYEETPDYAEFKRMMSENKGVYIG